MLYIRTLELNLSDITEIFHPFDQYFLFPPPPLLFYPLVTMILISSMSLRVLDSTRVRSCCISFPVWLISHSIMPCTFIHAAANGRISSFLKAEYYYCAVCDIFFMHSSQRHLCFHILDTVSNAAMNMKYRCLFCDSDFILIGHCCYPEEGLLDHTVVPFLKIKIKLFSLMAVPTYICTNSTQGFLPPHSLLNICYLCLLVTAILTGMHFLMISDDEYIFM